jgi:hypothetical protein
MDWNQVISVISDLVKDESTREQIYKRLLDASDWSEKDCIEEECLGYDDAFDNVWEEYYAEEKQEIDENDINYDEDE